MIKTQFFVVLSRHNFENIKFSILVQLLFDRIVIKILLCVLKHISLSLTHTHARARTRSHEGELLHDL
jgi:hypothetical protein